MTGNRTPNYQRQIAELQAEIRKLWAALATGPAGPIIQEEKTFSWSNAVNGSKISGKWWVPCDLTITSGIAGFKSASSTTVTIYLLIDGVSQYTFYLGAYDDRSSEVMSVHVPYGSSVQIEVTNASGGEDFTFTIGFVRDVGPR